MRRILPALCLLLAAAVAACGGNDSNDPTGTPDESGGASRTPAGEVQGFALFGSPEWTRAAIESLLADGDALPMFLPGSGRADSVFEGLAIPAEREIVGVTMVSTARVDSPFGEAYVAAYGEEPTDTARRAYDAVYLGVLAATAANSTDPAAVSQNITYVANAPGALTVAGPDSFAGAIEALTTAIDVDLLGASGLVDLTANGAQSKGAVEVWKLLNGSPAPLETRDVDLAAEIGAEIPAGALTPGPEPVPPLIVGILGFEGDGTGAFEGAQLAVDEINGAGGVFGEAVELTSEDPSADAGAATQALADAQVSFIVGPSDVGFLVAAAAVSHETRVPLLSLATTTEVEVGDDGNTIFSMLPLETLQTAALANLAIERDATSVCVAWEEGPYGEAMSKAFALALEAKDATASGPGSPTEGPAAAAACGE